MMIKPTQVTPMDNFTLRIRFNTDETRIFDLKPYLSRTFYRPLGDAALFKQVFVSDYTIEWPNGRDISPHELYELSVPAEN